MTKVIEISDETFEKLKDQLLADGGKDITTYEDLVGQKIFFRTVTYHAIGEVKKTVGRFVHLKSASWVADTGRFMNWIKDVKRMVAHKVFSSVLSILKKPR